MILCSPHNPVGRVWSKEELQQVADSAHTYGKWIISDEIHCDLIRREFIISRYIRWFRNIRMKSLSVQRPVKALIWQVCKTAISSSQSRNISSAGRSLSEIDCL